MDDSATVKPTPAGVHRLCAAGEYERALLVATAMVAALDARQESGETIEPLSLAEATVALATALECTGDYPEAAAQAERVIEWLDDDGAGREPLLAMALHTRATCHLVADQIDDALPLLERAREVFEHAGAVHEQDHFTVLLTMGDLCCHVGQSERGHGLYAIVLNALSEREPQSEEHAAWLNGSMARALFGLGSSHAQLGQGGTASDYLSRSIEMYDAALGVQHPEVLAAKQAAVAMYRIMGQTEAAEALEAELSATERHEEVGADDVDLVLEWPEQES